MIAELELGHFSLLFTVVANKLDIQLSTDEVTLRVCNIGAAWRGTGILQ